MSEWKEVVLNDIVSQLGDGLHGTPEYDDNGEYFFINGNNLGDGKITIKEGTKRCSEIEYNKYKKNLNNQTILVSINGTLGNVAVYKNEKCILGKSACYFNIKEGVDKIFIKYVVTDKTFQTYIREFANGSTIQNVPLKAMREYPFLLPPLPEQEAIAEVLSSLDDKIDLLHRNNKTLEQMAETLFRQWFVEEAEDSWEEKELGRLVDISRGASPRPIINYIKKGAVPWIKIADATASSSVFITQTHEFITLEGASKSVRVYPGDLILSNSATCGLPYIVQTEGCIHDGWLLFRNFRKINTLYLYFLLKSITKELDMLSDGTVQNNLNTGILKQYRIKVPSNQKVAVFTNEAKLIIDKINTNAIQIKNLENLRNTLLPKLMSGTVKVISN